MDAGASIVLKGVALLGATTAGSAVVAEVIAGTERLFLGIPQSWFLAALVGALVGLLLLSEIDAGKVGLPSEGSSAGKWITLAIRVGLLGLFVLGYALAAGWIVVAVSVWVPTIKQAGMVFSGLSGLVIKPMLPRYMAWLQRFTDRQSGPGKGGA